MCQSGTCWMLVHLFCCNHSLESTIIHGHTTNRYIHSLHSKSILFIVRQKEKFLYLFHILSSTRTVNDIKNEKHMKKFILSLSFHFYFLSFKMPHKIGFVLTICRFFSSSSSLFKLNISYKIRCVYILQFL